MKHTCLPPDGLMINLLREPTCLCRGPISFAWRTYATQAAYRLVVSEGRDAGRRGQYVYDSGWVESASCTGVVPKGLDGALTPGHLCYAQVAIRDREGGESPFSSPQPFTVDMDWASTDGIWAPANAEETVPDFVFLRGDIDLSWQDIDRVYLSVTAASPEPTRQFVYNMYVNGREIGVGPCRLGKTPDGTVTLSYATYDVTDALHMGRNVLSTIGYTTAEHAFLCQLTAFDAEGKPCIIANSGRDRNAWQALDGDAVFGKDNSIGTSYFVAHACNLTAPLYPFGFGEPDFVPDNRWTTPLLTGDIREGRLLVPDETEPVTRHPAKGAVTVTTAPDGTALIDLGAELIGGLRLTLCNPTDAPVAISLDYAEQLIPDGQGGLTVKIPMNTSNRYHETWTVRPGRQTLETLSMMAYRYVRVSGLPSPIAPADICGLELRKPFDESDGALMTDHALLADLYRLMKDTVRVTSQDIYVDSQSRERGAYEGDLVINMLAAYSVEASYAPARLSTAYLLGHRTWPADYLLTIIYAARADYMATGDDRLLCAWYEVLKANLFTDGFCEELGLIHSPVVGASNRNAVLVDWPPSERDGYDMAAPYNTVINAMSVRAYDDMAAIAETVGRLDDAIYFRTLRDGIQYAMIERLYDAESGLFRDGLAADGTPSPHMAQHATAYALNAGIYTDAAMARRMAEAMTRDGKLHVSVYAAFFLLEGLYRAGCGDIANRLLLDPDISDGARTWAYMLYRIGATVTTEAWNEKNKPNMTLSHPWGAAPAHMMVAGICGIRPTAPGYGSVDIHPSFDGIDNLSVSIPTIRGPIYVEWHTVGGTHTLALTLSAGITATVHLPNGLTESVSAGTYSWTC